MSESETPNLDRLLDGTLLHAFDVWDERRTQLHGIIRGSKAELATLTSAASAARATAIEECIAACKQEQSNYLDIADNLPTPASAKYEAIAHGCGAMAEHLAALSPQRAAGSEA